MFEARFFDPPTAMTIGEIVELTAALAPAGADLSRRIVAVAPLDLAGHDDLSFVESAKYLDRLKATRAGACLMAARFVSEAPASVIALQCRDPQRDFTIVARKMHAAALSPASLFGGKGVSPSAIVHPSARIDGSATIDPGAVIGPDAEVGAGTVIGAAAVIGPQVRIGSHCAIGAGSTITHSTIGDRVIIHPGCRVGQDGFGYVPSAKGHMKVPQVGGVVIHNDVEVGANTAIDRGGLRDTVIGEGTKIDNLVQIGHNVVIGRHCILAGQCGISGSVTIEDFAMLGGAAGVAPHHTIGKGAKLAARSAVVSDVPAGQTWGGYPAKPRGRWLRQEVALGRIAARDDKIKSPSISEAGDASEETAKAD